MAVTHSNIWIVGYGNIGRRVASLYQSKGIQTSVTTRSKETLKQSKLNNNDISHATTLFFMDLDQPIETPIIPSIITQANIFYFVPPPREGRLDTRIDNFLRNVKEQAQQVVLISTTGVYGDCNGAWVDESQPLKPTADRAWRRVDAEQQLKKWGATYDKRTIVLRVPGIYAKDKLPIARLQNGLPIVKQEESPWTNRIHADDLAMICYQAMNQLIQKKTDKKAMSIHKHEIYNVSDGHPSTMAEYFNQVADYSGINRPPQISLKQAEKELSTGMMSYMKESRRINNKKMIGSLHIKLKYPLLSDCLIKK